MGFIRLGLCAAVGLLQADDDDDRLKVNKEAGLDVDRGNTFSVNLKLLHL